MFALTKLNKQNKQMWVNMQKRLNEVQFPYDRLFSSDVRSFVKNKALSVGSCESYLDLSNYCALINHYRKIFCNPVYRAGSPRKFRIDSIHHQQNDVLESYQTTSNAEERVYPIT